MESTLISTDIILSIVTGNIYCGIAALHPALKFLTGWDIPTNHLPQAIAACRPGILEQLPQFKDLDVTGATGPGALIWVAQQIAKFGGSMLVHPLPEDTYVPEIEDALKLTDPRDVLQAAFDRLHKAS